MNGWTYWLFVTGWNHTMLPMHCDYFSSIVRPIWALIFPGSSTRTVWQIPAETPSSETGRNLARISVLSANYLCHTPQGSLIRRKILRRRAYGFTSPSKEVLSRIFVVLGRVWTREPSVQWQVRWPLDHRERQRMNFMWGPWYGTSPQNHVSYTCVCTY
jgi:hypothetical protein